VVPIIYAEQKTPVFEFCPVELMRENRNRIDVGEFTIGFMGFLLHRGSLDWNMSRL